MNYDSWKLGSGIDPRSEALAERCSDIESFLDEKLGTATAEVNRTFEGQWTVEPVLADVDDSGEISLEVSLRLAGVNVSGNASDLQELAQAFLKMSESLSQAAHADRTEQGLKLAPSASQREERRSQSG